jgi:beta-aspartyl-peptidase (threonine type)
MSRIRERLAAPVILAHGGAGSKPLTPAQRDCLRLALTTGFAVLRRRGSAISAVEETIRTLEASGLFNAGTGSRLQLDGARRMDAALMEGRHLRAGAVAGIEQIRHPISAARLVMERTGHVLLAGPPATKFARCFKLDRQPAPTRSQRRTANPAAQAKGRQRARLGLYQGLLREETVGAVALDVRGNLAAGASTGGIAFMLPGRVGDTPLIGCGVYADDEAGAVSMTGVGESIVRIAMAKEIVDRLAAGDGPILAIRSVFKKLMQRITPAEAKAGALVLLPDGRFAIRHCSPRMCAGYWTGEGKPVVRDRFR